LLQRYVHCLNPFFAYLVFSTYSVVALELLLHIGDVGLEGMSPTPTQQHRSNILALN